MGLVDQRYDIKDHIDDDGNALLDVWMSHGDKVVKMPEDFELMASTESCPIAGMYNAEKNFYGVQFHPEVTHTLQGMRIYEHFVIELCGCERLWTPANIIEDSISKVREQVGSGRVLLGLSGGVGSSVVAALLHKGLRRPTGLCLRGQRPAAQERRRPGHADVRREYGR